MILCPQVYALQEKDFQEKAQISGTTVTFVIIEEWIATVASVERIKFKESDSTVSEDHFSHGYPIIVSYHITIGSITRLTGHAISFLDFPCTWLILWWRLK